MTDIGVYGGPGLAYGVVDPTKSPLNNMYRYWTNTIYGDERPGGAGVAPYPGSMHPGGCNMAFADASVRFVSQTAPIGVLQALATMGGSESISTDEYTGR